MTPSSGRCTATSWLAEKKIERVVLQSVAGSDEGTLRSISWSKVVALLQSSHDVRDYLRTCWRRVERNLPIIVYAMVCNFSHSYAGHSFTLSRLAGFVVDEHLKLAGSLAFLCHVLSANAAATSVALATWQSSQRSFAPHLW